MMNKRILSILVIAAVIVGFFPAGIATPVSADIYNPGSGSGGGGGGSGTVSSATSTYVAVYNASGTVAGYANLTFTTSTGEMKIKNAVSGGIGPQLTLDNNSDTAGDQYFLKVADGNSGTNFRGGLLWTLSSIGQAKLDVVGGNASSVGALTTSASFFPNGLVQINNFDGAIMFPQDVQTSGCYAYSASTDFGTCFMAIYNSFASNSVNTIVLSGLNIDQAHWLTQLNLNRNGVVVNIIGLGNNILKYGGQATASSSMIFNFGNPTGHTQWQVTGFTLMGQSSLIAAAQANLATSTGITCGGSNGCVSGHFHDLNINGFGQQIHQKNNAYMNSYTAIRASGGNGGVNGDCYIQDLASNSGERGLIDDFTCTDPGNSTTSVGDIYFADGSNASMKVGSISLDDATIYNGFSNGTLDIDYIHIENSAFGTYGRYIPIYATSSAASTIVIHALEIANDTSGANAFDTIIKHGQNIRIFSWMLNNYGGGTPTVLADHSLNNGSESELICGGAVSGGGLTNIINNQAYSAAVANSCVSSIANSFPFVMYIDSGNTVHIRDGNGDVATVNSTGNWTFSNNGSAGSVTVTGSETISTTLGVTGQVNANGGLKMAGSVGTFTVASMGGGSLTAGTCASTTTALSGSIATSSAAFVTTPTVDPGPDFYWETVLIATSSVSTRVCAAGITGTPTASTYIVKVIQ